MAMNYSFLVFVTTLSIYANVLEAAPRITAQVDTVPEAALTTEEQRAVSITAGRLFRHAYDAKIALEANNTEKATKEIEFAEKLVQIIENAMPSSTVKTSISSGEFGYEYEHTVKSAIIPIQHEHDMVSLVAPLHHAYAEENNDKESDATTIGVVDHRMRDVHVTLNLDWAKTGLQVAREELAADDVEAASEGVATILHSVQFTAISVDVPLHRAQENLMLAKAAAEQGNKKDARALLDEVNSNLSTYESGSGMTDKKEIDELRKEIKALSEDLDTTDKGVGKTIEGWWDRIGELMR
jgi:YfdX protein